MDLSHGVADMLFESDTITIDDHDDIDKVEQRIEKGKKLLEILLTKSSDWIPRFIQILHEADHERLSKD